MVSPALKQQGDLHHCGRCKEYKELGKFPKSRALTGKGRIYCTKCNTDVGRHRRHTMDPLKLARERRQEQLKGKYGITIADYDAMLAAQGGTCAICNGPPPPKGYHVDHCHTTGVVRALLCFSCNTALGHVQDNTDTLRRMIDYLNVKR